MVRFAHISQFDYTDSVPEGEEALYISENFNKNPRTGSLETPSRESDNENENNPDYPEYTEFIPSPIYNILTHSVNCKKNLRTEKCDNMLYLDDQEYTYVFDNNFCLN